MRLSHKRKVAHKRSGAAKGWAKVVRARHIFREVVRVAVAALAADLARALECERPTGVEVDAGNWSLSIRPLFAAGPENGAQCEWWWSHIEHPTNEAMAKATFAGTASYMTMQGLRPDTQYYVWLRAVNAYGKSGLLAVTAKTLALPVYADEPKQSLITRGISLVKGAFSRLKAAGEAQRNLLQGRR